MFSFVFCLQFLLTSTKYLIYLFIYLEFFWKFIFYQSCLPGTVVNGHAYHHLTLFSWVTELSKLHGEKIDCVDCHRSNWGPLHTTSQEPWPWNRESPKESVQRPSQHTSKIMSCGHIPSSVVWSHMWLGPQPNASSMNFYSYESSHTTKYNEWWLWAFRVS